MTQAELEGQKALVTGATGFIGGHLLDRLQHSGAEIHAVSRRPPVDDLRARWHEADLADFDAVRRLISSISPNVVFHLAGETRAARELELILPTFRSNLVSTVNILAAAADASSARVVLTGSLEEPEPGDVVASSPYAVSKLGARAYSGLFSEMMNLPVIVLRVFMVYGPAQRDLRKLVPYVIMSLLRGESPRLTSGRREIDWVYVGDVVDAFATAAVTDNVSGASVDVGSGEAVSIRSLVQRLAAMIAPHVEPEFGAIADRPLEQIRIANVEAAEAAIGWRPTVGLEEGLLRTVQWYREQFELGRL